MFLNIRYLSLILLCLTILPVEAQQDLLLPRIFSDHMVVQEGESFNVWGRARPRTEVVVRIADVQVDTRADAMGRWSLSVPMPTTDAPWQMQVSSEDERVVYNDVVPGEVWLCSGQSNMQWELNKSDEGAAYIEKSENPNIRLLQIPRQYALEPQEDVDTQGWKLCSAQTVKDFSAVGYHFGKKLNEATGKTIGLISSNYGGTPAQAWTPAKTLQTFPRFRDFVKGIPELKQAQAAYEKTFNLWFAKLHAADLGIEENWAASDYDDRDWDTAVLPSGKDAIMPMGDTLGICWLRKQMFFSEAWAGKDLTLFLAAIADFDVLYVNGQEVARTWIDVPDTPMKLRNYTLPAESFKAGADNTLAVRIINTNGQGGMFKYHPWHFVQLAAVGETDETLIFKLTDTSWKWKLGVDASQVSGIPVLPELEKSTVNQKDPSVLFNRMIAPLIPYNLAGVIWYQGESNEDHPKEYAALFPALIQSWREAWQHKSLPFYFVQLARFGGANGAWADVREAQTKALDLPHTGMAVAMDVGESEDIHPRDKKTVGERLARLAKNRLYGVPCEDQGPQFLNCVLEGQALRIEFSHADLLHARADGLTFFEVADREGSYHKVDARVEHGSVVLDVSVIEQPVSLRYAWSDDPGKGGLYNRSGLPAPPFRADF